MAKAKKAPQKKPQKNSGVKWASIAFLVISGLVALSMILTGIFTQFQNTAAPVPTPVPIVVNTSTPAP